MAGPLIDAKLFRPRVRGGTVQRSRIVDLLDRGVDAKLTLISAPAGFGKSTALAAWVGQPSQQDSVAWLSLDADDADPVTFWTYVVAALQRVVPGLSPAALPLLTSANPPVHTLLTILLNDLGTDGRECHLVLDDYHMAEGPGIADGLSFLLDHAPPNLHVVISTRSDPDLPLARLRARRELVEVRAADLRFTDTEATAYLAKATTADLTPHDIAVLGSRTEGWIAALQLAALSLRGREDPAAFISGFAGDDRYIVDYLVDEVLARQPHDVRRFLMETSLLDRLTGSLCDAVTERPGGKSMLEALDRWNLFVVPLDDNRHWYRYHHLFADVLQAHLAQDPPEHVRHLHRRASHWYDGAGDPVSAVRHAIAAGDVDTAADLVESAVPTLLRDRHEGTIRGWLDGFPADMVRDRPLLAMGFVAALMAREEFDDVPSRLQDLERWIDSAGRDAVEEDPDLAALPGKVELYWAALSLVTGDHSGLRRHARQAIDRAAREDHVTRAGAFALSGLASWGAGDLEAAHRGYSACVEGLRNAGHHSDALGATITLADLRTTQGRLGDALTTYERALEIASHEPDVVRGTPDMYVGLALIAEERGDLPTAEAALQRSDALGEALDLPQNPWRRRVAKARLLEARGDPAGALTLLDEAEQTYTGDFAPNVQPIAAMKARLLARSGRLDQALDWVRRSGVGIDDDPSYLSEYEHITLIGVLLAAASTARLTTPRHVVTEFLDRLLAAAEEGGRTGSVIEILTLQARARSAAGDLPGALDSLDRALRLAEPEGYVRVFTQGPAQGPTLRPLLSALANRRPGWAYPRRLVAAMDPERPSTPERESPRHQHGLHDQYLVEPLSQRELQVLRLLTTDLSGPDIARELVVSLNTVRTHTKSIYAKLGVTSRREAVTRAGALHLLPHTRP